MGITRFAGPVYGAKSLLYSASYAAGAISSGASTALLSPVSKFVVPGYEDWLLTECVIQCSTCSSNASQFIVKVEPTYSSVTGYQGHGGSGQPDQGSTTTLAGAAFTINSGTSTSINAFAVAASKPAQEYEGWLVPANSTVRLVSSANTPMGITTINIHGFRRYFDSTRAV